jgi:hypothetical protein
MLILRWYISALFACLICANVQAGYTQYFTWHTNPDSAALKACIAEMRLIILARTNILAGPGGSNDVILDAYHVNLNGIGANANDPFVFPGDFGFNFCKTEVKPYDAVVTACLLVAHDHFPSSELSIDSDGSWSDGDWDEGIKLYSSVLGRHPRNPIAPLWYQIGWRNTILICLLIVLLLVLTVPHLWKRLRKWHVP